MICISKQWLDLVAPGTVLDSRPGLFVSPIFSFGGGGNGGEDTAAFEAEDMPRTLVLVGMADRYGVGARQSSNILTLCVDSTGLGARRPSPPELKTLITQLSELAERTVPIVDLHKAAQVKAQVLDLLVLLQDKLRAIDPPSPEEEARASSEYRQWGELESRLKEQEPITTVIEQLAPPPRGDTAASAVTVIEQLAPPPRGDTTARSTNILVRAGAQFIDKALADNPDGPVRMHTEISRMDVTYDVWIGDSSDSLSRRAARCIWHRVVVFGHTDRTVAGGAAFVEAARMQETVAWAALELVEARR